MAKGYSGSYYKLLKSLIAAPHWL